MKTFLEIARFFKKGSFIIFSNFLMESYGAWHDNDNDNDEKIQICLMF